MSKNQKKKLAKKQKLESGEAAPAPVAAAAPAPVEKKVEEKKKVSETRHATTTIRLLICPLSLPSALFRAVCKSSTPSSVTDLSQSPA